MAKLAKFSEQSASVLKPEVQKGEKIRLIHYSKFVRSPYQYRDKGKTAEEIRTEMLSLAMGIKATNGLAQPVIARKVDVDQYELVAGHNRIAAITYLVEEEGLKQFEFVPCVVRELTDAQAEFICNDSNNFRPKTDWELMHELETKKKLLEESPEDFPHLQGIGRMVEKLASQMNMKRSTVGEYLQISKNLSDKGMEAFQSGELNKSAAVAISALTHQEQDQLIDTGVTKQKDIKAYKEEKVEKTVHRTTVTDTVKTVKTHSIEEPEVSVPKFGTDEPDVIDVLPGQLKVANTEMELVEEENVVSTISDNRGCVILDESYNQCKCCICGGSSEPSRTYVFYGKPYCVNAFCLEQLLFDLADTGVITINSSEADTKGNIIRS